MKLILTFSAVSAVAGEAGTKVGPGSFAETGAGIGATARSKIKAGSNLRELLGLDQQIESSVFNTIAGMADNMGFSVTADGTAYISWKQFNESIMPIGYDINGDGKLSLDEMKRSDYAAPNAEVFAKADKNGDGHLSGHDWIKLAEEYDPKHKGIPGLDQLSYRDMTQIAHHTVRTSQKNFDHMDANDDGRVTAEEMKDLKDPDFDKWAMENHEDADYLAWNILQRQGGGSILHHKDVHSLLEVAAQGGSIDDLQEGLRMLNPDKLALLHDWMDGIHEQAIDHMEWHTTHTEHGFDIEL